MWGRPSLRGNTPSPPLNSRCPVFPFLCSMSPPVKWVCPGDLERSLPDSFSWAWRVGEVGVEIEMCQDMEAMSPQDGSGGGLELV